MSPEYKHFYINLSVYPNYHKYKYRPNLIFLYFKYSLETNQNTTTEFKKK